MNRAMAWNIAGVGRRTRDAAVEAARRAGMRLDDWLDEAIADYAGLDQRARPDMTNRMTIGSTPPPDVWNALPDETHQQSAPRAAGTPDTFNSVIERFETRLARAEAQAARAFETVAQILERDDAARDSDRRALIDAVRRLESIRTNFTGAAQTAARHGDALPSAVQTDPKPPFDLKAAVSQIAMRRHELEARARSQRPPELTPQKADIGAQSDAGSEIPPRGRLRAGVRRNRRGRRPPRPRNCCSTTFGPWRSSSMICAASGPIRAPRLSTSAPCAPKSKP